MRILFVYPNIDSNARNELNLGICWIAAVLKKGGHDVTLFRPAIFSSEAFVHKLKRYEPDLIAVSTTTNQYRYAVKYAAIAKKNSGIPIVFGGVHPSLAPGYVISNPNVDILCRGEGEYPLLELANALEQGKPYHNIPNLWIKEKDGSIIKNDLRALIQDLTSLPFPDRAFFGQKQVLDKNGGRFDVSVGRGCPFECPYCCNSAAKKINAGKGKFMRFRPVDNVIEEINFFRKKYDIREIHFQDDTFTYEKKWFREFSNKYSREVKIPFHCGGRVETIDEEMVTLLKKAGCISITMGVESGNEKLRREMLKRNMSNNQFIKVFRLLREAGVQTVALNMVGIPGETPATIRETIDLNRKLNPSWIGVSVFNPYPSTDLYNLCKGKNYLKTGSFENYAPSYMNEEGYLLNLPTISKTELIKGYREFQDFAAGKYIKEKFPWLYPMHIVTKPLLKTRMRKILVRSALRFLFDREFLRKKHKAEVSRA